MRQRKNTKLDFTGQPVYVGIDIHKKSWKVSIASEQFEHKTFTQPPDPEVLLRYLKKNFPGATYYTAYEAGYFGYNAHDSMTSQGVHSIVVNPADIPTKNKERYGKRDKVDARKLMRELRNGSLDPLYIPPPAARAARTLIRTRCTLISKQTRCKNQIKSMLSFYGKAIPQERGYAYWSRLFIHWLESLEFAHQSQSASLRVLIKELLHLRSLIAEITREIRKVAVSEPYRIPVQLLKTIPGIGDLSSMVLLTELVDINRFKTLDELCSYCGLIPRERSSGERESKGSLSPLGNRFLRYILIEAAWVAVKKDPALLQKFQALSRRMKKQRAIISIARSLLNRIRYVMRSGQPYKSCVVN